MLVIVYVEELLKLYHNEAWPGKTGFISRTEYFIYKVYLLNILDSYCLAERKVELLCVRISSDWYYLSYFP